MFGAVEADPNILVPALLVAIPATLAAYASLRGVSQNKGIKADAEISKKRLETSNGRTAGQLAEEAARTSIANGEAIAELAVKMDEHAESDRTQFALLHERLNVHQAAIAAVVAQHDKEK